MRAADMVTVEKDQMVRHSRALIRRLLVHKNATTSLRLIASEMRQSAKAAYGNPPSTRITADTLCDYADQLDRIANDPNQTNDARFR